MNKKKGNATHGIKQQPNSSNITRRSLVFTYIQWEWAKLNPWCGGGGNSRPEEQFWLCDSLKLHCNISFQQVSLISLIMKLSWNPCKSKTALDLLQCQKDILSDLNDKDDEKIEAEMSNPQLDGRAVRLAMKIWSTSEVNYKYHLYQVCGPYCNQAVVLTPSQRYLKYKSPQFSEVG